MNTSNPTLGAFNRVSTLGVGYEASGAMTVDGTIHKAGVLGVLLALAFAFTWTGLSHAAGVPAAAPIMIGALGGFIIAMIISFNPPSAPYLSPVYALVEGFVLAAISYPLEQLYPFIVLQAATMTIATLFGMLFAYKARLIVVNNTFRAVIIGATMTIFFYYLAGFIALFFHFTLPGLGFQGGLLSIGISVLIVIVAALNLVLDFDYIANNAGSAPKYMEWYGAFSLLVTLVWLYLEILRLLAKMRDRN
ncbi:MAG TPA: Bax inhibitor-1/YccA family protein [Candidatus Methylacidiphilales bacterium]|nr:Bax inhibitor-1/YccA family protein [Candidatus Methylacidiphilales bacterium]